MRDETQSKISVIQAKDPAKFQERYNNTAKELAGYDPEITVKIEAGVFYAIFMYTTHKQRPETVSDEFTLAGIRHTCSECPYLEIGNDNRRKVWPCRYSEYGSASKDSPACELLLKKLMAGKVRLRDTEAGYDD